MAQLIFRVAPALQRTLLLCGLVAACSGDDGPAVPFKFGEPEHPVVAPTDQPVIPTVDRVADPHADVFAIAVDAQGAITLTRTSHGEASATQVAPLHTLTKGCSADPAATAVRRLSASHLFATVEISCSAEATDPTAAAKPPQLTRMHWLLSSERAPRVMERFSVLPAQPDGTVTTTLTLDARAEDVDGDQNADVIVTVKYASAGATEREVSLRWMNRVGGLDRDRSEPEATFATMLTAARKMRASHVAYASALEEIVTGHELLCSESGHARIVIGGRSGIVCGRSKALGNVWLALARSRTDQAGGAPDALRAALVALEKLSDPNLSVDAAERSSVEQGLKQLAARANWQWQPGPSISEVRAPEVRLPMIAFVDDHTLLLRGATQQHYDLNTTALTTVNEAPSDLLLRDSAGGLAVVAIERHCDGDRLKIVRAEQVVGGIVLGASVSEPLIATRTAPASSRCDQAQPSHRAPSDGRWTVLGWTPAAIVLTAGHVLHTVPLDAVAHALGAAVPTTLPLTAPVAAGAIAADGSAHATLTSVGIVVSSASAGATLVQPLGPVSARDVAVAPNAARLAYVFGGRVFIGSPSPATP